MGQGLCQLHYIPALTPPLNSILSHILSIILRINFEDSLQWTECHTMGLQDGSTVGVFVLPRSGRSQYLAHTSQCPNVYDPELSAAPVWRETWQCPEREDVSKSVLLLSKVNCARLCRE